MPTRRTRPLAIALAACAGSLLGAGGAQAAIPTLGASTGRAAVQDVAVLPAGASLGDAISPHARLRLTIGLAPSDPAGLSAYAATVSTPGSGLYHHDLSTAQFARRFGADPLEVAAVSATLRDAGLAVGRLSRDRLSIEVGGDARRVQRALRTTVRRVRLRGGRRAYADTVAPSLPADVAADVQGIVGLSTAAELRPEGALRSRRGTMSGDATPAVTAQAGPGTCAAAQTATAGSGAHNAQQIGQAYGLDGLWSQGDLGAGTTVALFELEPFDSADIAAYQSCDGLANTIETTNVDGGPSSTTTGVQESELDIEDVAGLAPDATIHVYQGPNGGNGAYDTYQQIVSEDTAKVISTSWGTCEANVSSGELTMENTLFHEAAVQGQSLLAAAGDNGADDCRNSTDGNGVSHAGVRAVDDPAAQPYVTGVGGTSMPGAAGQETVWNDRSGASGGGTSAFWERPTWQASSVSQTAVSCHEKLSATGSAVATASTTSCREVPDVSADADPSAGYIVDIAGSWGVAGGTSAAAPTWAALVTLADASGYCGAPIGFLNPILYGLPESDFHDVTSGNNTEGSVTGYSAATGYDMASGLGAPNGSALVPALCGAGAGATVPEPVTTTSTTSTTSTTPTTQPSPPPATVATTVAPPTTTTSTTTRPTGTPGSGARPPTGATVQVSAPARLWGTVGRRVRRRLRAHDSVGLRLAYTARGLPPGVIISRTSGEMSGRPRRAGTYTARVSVVDTRGDGRTAVIRWTIRRPASRHRRSPPPAHRGKGVIRVGFW